MTTLPASYTAALDLLVDGATWKQLAACFNVSTRHAVSYHLRILHAQRYEIRSCAMRGKHWYKLVKGK